MAHPEQQATPLSTPGLEHCSVAVVVNPLCPLGKLPGILRLAEVFGYELVEAFCLLRAMDQSAQGIVVQAVHGVGVRDSIYRLHAFFAHGSNKVLPVHDVGHTHLAVQLVAAADMEVLGRLERVVRTAAANAVCSGMRDVVHSGMLGGNHRPEE